MNFSFNIENWKIFIITNNRSFKAQIGNKVDLKSLRLRSIITIVRNNLNFEILFSTWSSNSNDFQVICASLKILISFSLFWSLCPYFSLKKITNFILITVFIDIIKSWIFWGSSNESITISIAFNIEIISKDLSFLFSWISIINYDFLFVIVLS